MHDKAKLYLRGFDTCVCIYAHLSAMHAAAAHAQMAKIHDEHLLAGACALQQWCIDILEACCNVRMHQEKSNGDDVCRFALKCTKNDDFGRLAPSSNACSA